MFGGLCFMVNGKMCVCARRTGGLMVRFDPELTDTIMEKEGCTPMVHSGKAMRGFAFVDADMLRTKKQLAYWVGIALEYNQFAKSSKKAPQKKTSPKKKN